jgi:hypothetical protein
MYQDLEQYIFDGMVPAYESYAAAFKSGQAGMGFLRLPAASACEKLVHVRDQIKHLDKKRYTRKNISGMNHAYDLLTDVWNALKHGKPESPYKLIKDANSVQEIIQFTRFADEEGMYAYLDMRIRVTRLDGGFNDLLEVCTAVLNFWMDFLSKEGLITQVQVFKYPGDQVLTRKEVEDHAANGFGVREGSSGTLPIKARTYDPVSHTFRYHPD